MHAPLGIVAQQPLWGGFENAAVGDEASQQAREREVADKRQGPC